MKTRTYKKIALMLAVGIIGLSTTTFAQTPGTHDQSGGQSTNPFDEGVRGTALNAAQIASLQEYLDASKTALLKALDLAKGKSFRESNRIYLEAIKKVVMESYQNAPRSGLLLRFALNESLGLTFGIPSADGLSITVPGVLVNTSNQDLLTVMLEDSIGLALKYYQDDEQAVKNGSLLNLPYMSYAIDQLTLTRTWLESIPEYKLAYDLSRTSIQYYLNAAAKDDEVHQKYYADEILDANQTLVENPETPPSDPKVLMGKVRVLRGKIRKLLEATSKKLTLLNETRSAPVGTSTTTTASNVGSTRPNAIGMEFVALPGGVFTMGSGSPAGNQTPATTKSDQSDETPHTVSVSGFQMEVTDVTQMQYFKIMGSNPSRFKTQAYCPNSFTSDGGGMCPNNPVETVSWNDAQNYINKLNAGNDGFNYRLPTEAEWEYAARAGTNTTYSFGDSASTLGDYAWIDSNSGSKTHEVKTKKPNAFGLYDMHGNVWQWVQDWYGNYDVNDSTNPKGASSGSSRVLRGGSWKYDAGGARSAFRYSGSPGNSNDGAGFRLVRTPR